MPTSCGPPSISVREEVQGLPAQDHRVALVGQRHKVVSDFCEQMQAIKSCSHMKVVIMVKS